MRKIVPDTVGEQNTVKLATLTGQEVFDVVNRLCPGMTGNANVVGLRDVFENVLAKRFDQSR